MPKLQVAAINSRACAFIFFYPEHAVRQHLLYKNIWIGQTAFRVKYSEEELAQLIAESGDEWEEVDEETRRRLETTDLSSLIRNLLDNLVWPRNATERVVVNSDCSGNCRECHGGCGGSEPVLIER